MFTPFSFVGIQPPYDADAQAFFNAVTGGGDTLTTTQKNAVNTLVLDLKGYGIWNNLQAFYPFVGGTATAHKWNLMNPADTDAAYRLVFGASVTHTANGYVGSGTNLTSYADTFYEIGVDNTTDDFCFGLYVYNNLQEPKHDFGYYNNVDDNLLATYYVNIYYANTKAFQYLTGASSDSRGMWNVNLDSGTLTLYKGGSSLASKAQNMPTSPAGDNMVIGASDRRSIGQGITENASKTYCNAWLGYSMDATEQANFYTAVQAYNTTLSRNV